MSTTLEYGYSTPGQVKLEPGDELRDGTIVLKVSESNAVVRSMSKVHKVVEDKVFGTKAEFDAPSKEQRTSTQRDKGEIVARHGAAWLAEWLKGGRKCKAGFLESEIGDMIQRGVNWQVCIFIEDDKAFFAHLKTGGGLWGEWEPRCMNATHFGHERLTVERREKCYKDFLKASELTPEVIAEKLKQQKPETQKEQETVMAKKTKTKKVKSAASNPAVVNGSTRVKIFDNSAYKIAVSLGADGVSLARTEAIIRAQGSDLASGTIAQNHCLGKNGKGNPATLTKDQTKQLLASAEEPKEVVA